MTYKNFTYQEKDIRGEKTLDVISKADKFNFWMFNTILPYTKGEILEIGSGIGNISLFFLENGSKIALSDIRNNYCQNLETNFNKYSNLNSVIQLDIVDKEFDKKYSQYFNKFDSVFSLNVMEHIENEQEAITNCKKLLKHNGVLITLVPAYKTLYCKFDEELKHFRRYTKKSLKNVLIKEGFAITRSFYFNTIGIIGWFISGKILRKKTIPENQMKFYNKLVPLFKIIDKLLFNSMGLSVICIAKPNKN